MKKSHRTIATASIALLMTCIFLVPKISAAKDATPDVKASFDQTALRKGEFTTLSIEVKVPSGYHFYTMKNIEDGPIPMKVKINDPALVSEGLWFAPKPHEEFDANFDKDVEFYENKFTIQQNVKITGSLKESYVPIKFSGQICTTGQCIKVVEKLQVPLTFEEGEPRAELTTPKELKGVVSANSVMDEGLIVFLIIAFLAGLGALATPCVFPMIPITMSFFSKFSKVSVKRSAIMATIYSASIMLTYTLVGIIISIALGAAGMQEVASHPIFNMFMAGLLVFFAFNLFGLFEISVPSFLISKTAQKEQELNADDDGSLSKQAAGVFFMALTFALVSFTCTFGFIGVVVAAAANGEWFYPTIGMLSFSFAFSLPFFFLAMFPSFAEKFQGRGGDWMVAVKVTLGFIEFAGAFKFLSNIDLIWRWEFFTRPFVLTIWVAVFFLAGLYLLRVFALPHNDTSAKNIGPLRMFVAMMFIALSAYAATGIRSADSMGGWLDSWLPPSIYPGQAEEWIENDIDKAYAEAKEKNIPLFVNFTGYS